MRGIRESDPTCRATAVGLAPIIPYPCARHFAATAVTTNYVLDSQTCRPIHTSTRFANDKKEYSLKSRVVILHESLHPTHEYVGHILPMRFQHAILPRALEPTEIVLLCRGQTLAEAGEPIQYFKAALSHNGLTTARAQIFE